MKTLKGRLLDFCKVERRYKEILAEFGNSGSLHAHLYELQKDKLVLKIRRGVYKAV